MPRTIAKAYLDAHHDLHKLWLKDQSIFAELTAQGQWLLHDYFRPASNLTNAELVIHRKAISIQRRSLPQQAGKAYVTLRVAIAEQGERAGQVLPPRSRSGRRHEYNVTVTSVVKPLDPHAFARSLAKVSRAEAAAAVKLGRQSEVASLLPPESAPTGPSSVAAPVASTPDSATGQIRTTELPEPPDPL